MKQHIALLQLVALLVMGVPSTTSAQDEGVNGSIDVRVLVEPGEEHLFEYVGISFTTTDESILTLTDFTIADNEGVRFTFPSTDLPGESEVFVCQDTEVAVASGICDLYFESGFVWDDAEETFILRDHTGEILLEILVGSIGPDNFAFGQTEVNYPVPVVASLVIDNPPEDELILSSVEQFLVMYTDDNEAVTETLSWEVRRDNCADGEVVLSSETVASTTYSYTAPELTIDIDTDSLSNGRYCFVVWRNVPMDVSDLRAERLFIVDRYIYPRYEIEGTLYHDVNANGRFEASVDRLLPGREVRVERAGESYVATTTSDASGRYRFSVEAGTWNVFASQPEFWRQTGVIRGEEEIYSVPLALATTTPFGCEVTLEETDTDEALVVGRCDFLSAESRPNTPPRQGGTRVDLPRPLPQVLGASTSPAPTCGRYLSTYMSPYSINQTFEVQKLQLFLTGQGWFTPLTGRYDRRTVAHVKALQAREQVSILQPWVDAGLVPNLLPTGNVFKTTRSYINNTLCPGSDPYTLR